MKSFLQILFFAFLAAIAVASVVLVFPAFHKFYTIKTSKLDADNELKKQKNECLLLRQKLSNIKNSTSEIEKIAREKFNYCKSGETVYKFNDN